MTAEEMMPDSYSPRTIASYSSAWKTFEEWMHDSGKPALLPVDPDDVAAYLKHLHKQGRKPATLHQVCSALRWLHHEQNLENPCSSNRFVRLFKAFRKQAPKPRQAEPLTEEYFSRIRATATKPRPIGRGRYETEDRARRRGLLDIALIGVMRDAMLRRSEAAVLLRTDIIKQRDGGGVLYVAQSKTDQEGEGDYQYLSPDTMRDLQKIKNMRGDDPSVFGLSSRHIQRRIAAACTGAGLKGFFAGHSPRVGMTVDLVRQGFAGPEIQQCGRWKDPRMVQHYSKKERATQNAVARYYKTRQ